MNTPNRYNILYIDDEPNNLIVFKSAFFRQYNVFTALSGEEGLAIMASKDIHVMITDQKMPGMSGIDVLRQAIKDYPKTIRMIITAYSDLMVIIQAINECGIYQYVLKPWDSRELKIIIDNALESYRLSRENEQLLADLKEANNRLEEKVKIRTLELDEKNQRLTETNRLKDKLFRIISHDLKEPVVSLGFMLEILRTRPDEISLDKKEEYLTKVQGYVRELKDLINNLLQWSLAEVSQEIFFEPVPLHKVIAKNIDLFKLPAAQKGILLESNVNGNEILVHGNENMIHLIIRNLISNAIKFTTRNGKVSLHTKCENGQVAICVKDSGVGMSQELLGKIFDHGNYISTSGTNREQGSGLGLHISKDFIEKQKGTLLINSTVGEGTEFSFFLPIAK